MTSRRVLLLVIAAFAPVQARAQGDLNSQEGLEQATPTDNVNEIGGGGADNGAGGNPAVDDFPADNGGSDFDIGNSINNGDSGGGGNDIFDDKPVNVGNNKAGANGGDVSAFGTADPAAEQPEVKPKPGAAPANALPGNVANGTVPPVPVNGAAVPAGNPAVPVGNPAAAAGGVNPAVGNPGSGTGNAVPTNDATGDAGNAALTPPPPPEPEIKAPPIPPPNEFAGAPPVPGTMRLMAEGEAPEEYGVQPGDTLFDICDQLLDEPGYWPRLWALNPEIKNPHFIFPNMRLRFYPGDDETPPYLQVVAEEDVIPIDKGEIEEAELVAEKVTYPEDPAFEEPPGVEVIGPEGVDALQDELMVVGKRFDGSEISVQVPGFIFAEEKEPLAYIIGGREGELMAAPEERVILEATGTIATGTTYTLLRPGEEIDSPETGDFVGYKYYFVAHLKVEKNVGEEVYTGRVQKGGRLGVRPNDILVNYISTNRTIPNGERVGSVGSAEAHVVGFAYYWQEVGGQGSYAFLDKGNGDGITPGMYLPIYQTPGYITSAFGSTNLPEDYEKIGVMRIIDATDAGAVGYIVQQKREVRVGDRTDKG